eukprot:GEMP01049192.1.p1 GENE.GEMP01049192.1~~GEMP01049192.1.p1  ORF type:complete len:328 (+),score=46.88 GEMP01049192.1:130-1113(+)
MVILAVIKALHHFEQYHTLEERSSTLSALLLPVVRFKIEMKKKLQLLIRRRQVLNTWRVLLGFSLGTSYIQKALQVNHAMDVIKGFLTLTWKGSRFRAAMIFFSRRMNSMLNGLSRSHRVSRFLRKEWYPILFWGIETRIIGSRLKLGSQFLANEIENYKVFMQFDKRRKVLNELLRRRLDEIPEFPKEEFERSAGLRIIQKYAMPEVLKLEFYDKQFRTNTAQWYKRFRVYQDLMASYRKEWQCWRRQAMLLGPMKRDEWPPFPTTTAPLFPWCIAHVDRVAAEKLANFYLDATLQPAWNPRSRSSFSSILTVARIHLAQHSFVGI